MEINYPPYTITDKILNLSTQIMKKIGEANYFKSIDKYPELRRKSRIKSIHSSLAIENNQLSLFQVEDVIDGKPVIGEQKDIQEVKNAYKAYEEIEKINPYSEEDLKKIHEIMTFIIEKDAGKYRNHGEAVYDGDVQIFMAPPHTMVPALMSNLFAWMNDVKDKVNPLILSSVFHYEFVFIHPFSDGNGRTARLWQNVLLKKWNPLFEYIPIESIIQKYQKEYYESISECNHKGNSNAFIEFMLKMIDEILDEVLLEVEQESNNVSEKVNRLLGIMEFNIPLTANEIMKRLSIKSKETLRNSYLNPALENGLIKMMLADKPNSKNQRYIKT